MLDTSITATSFAPDAEGGPLPDRAQVVIVGGGVIGSSIAYHLAGLGITDVAGARTTSDRVRDLVARGRTGRPRPRLAPDDPAGRLRRGRLPRARGRDRRRRPLPADRLADAGRERGQDDGAPVRGRDRPSPRDRGSAAGSRHEVPEIWPLAVADGLVGGLLQPGDGTVNPGYAALAFAKGAHDRGVTIREGVLVEELLLDGTARDGRPHVTRRRRGRDRGPRVRPVDP